MSVSEGLRIISVAKLLFAFQSDANIASFFGATRLAGRTGLLLSALRSQTRMERRKFTALAANSYLDRPTLNFQIVPWLVKAGFIEVQGSDDESAVVCNVIDHDAILRATSEFFHSLGPTQEERLVLEILNLGIRIPTTKSDAFGQLSSNSEELVSRSLDLANGYGVVKLIEPDGSKEPVIYSPLIWGDKINNAGRALSHLDNTKRELVLKLIESVRGYQGIPETAALKWANANGDGGLVDFAVGLGLLDRTEIGTRSGKVTRFLTSPHLYGELAATQGRDVCDRVRLFLDSIRHGQHYGDWMTGRIKDPVVLLNGLINRGEIGPCTAIGNDYMLVEKAGVISVQPISRPNQYVMRLVQKDTVELIRDILEKRERPAEMSLNAVGATPNQDRFVSSEQSRASLGRLPEATRIAEQEMIRNLREMD